MTYDTAKALKDAGFPQDGHNYIFSNGEIQCYFTDSDEAARIPHLEEMIEATPLFYGLHRMVDGEWMAFIYDIEDSTRQLETNGSTPLEAVANLWLSLR